MQQNVKESYKEIVGIISSGIYQKNTNMREYPSAEGPILITLRLKKCNEQNKTQKMKYM